MKTFDDYIKSIKDLSDLKLSESENAFDQILTQKISEDKIIDFLISLSKKGESVDEIYGAVISIKKKLILLKVFQILLIHLELEETDQKHLISQQ